MIRRLVRTGARGAAVLALVVCCAGAAPATTLPAFPGAEGFGAVATGGRGGDVYYVTNLDDAGPGSLRDAVSHDNRTVLFKVSGTIHLEKRIDVKASHITIAGQTAPGDGICVRGRDVVISGDDVVVRFLRFRPGDEAQAEHDALTLWDARRAIIDHCSMSWSTDSVNDVVKGSGEVTVQWCMISEPLNRSAHSKGAHGYGTGWGGQNGGASYHHNLIAHCNSRSPRLGSEADSVMDVRNNVVYNMGGGWAYGGERARFNYVNNYYVPGPNTQRQRELFRPSSGESRGYFAGNAVAGAPDVARDNALGVALDDGMDPADVLVAEPFPVAPVTTHPAEEAMRLVLDRAGAVLPARDAVDARIVADVRNRTGAIIDSQADVGGWPTLKSAEAPVDTDADGMPDAWERANQLDPNDPADGKVPGGDGYTNLEHYLNELAAGIAAPTGG
jgi:pectate lyase